MTEQPNIKAEMLQYLLNEGGDGEYPSLRYFAQEYDYEEHRVATKVHELSDVLNWGVSAMVPWITDEERAREKLQSWEGV